MELLHDRNKQKPACIILRISFVLREFTLDDGYSYKILLGKLKPKVIMLGHVHEQ